MFVMIRCSETRLRHDLLAFFLLLAELSGDPLPLFRGSSARLFQLVDAATENVTAAAHSSQNTSSET